MRFDTWNVRSLCRAGSLTEAARELASYKLDLVGVQVRWDKRGTVRAVNYNFSMEKKTKIINCEQNFLYTTEYYRPLREQSLLAIGCRI